MSRTDLLPVQLRKPIYKRMPVDLGSFATAVQAIVLGQIDDQNAIEPGTGLVKEFFSLAMSYTKKDDVDLVVPLLIDLISTPG
jgi:hypothetical protein